MAISDCGQTVSALGKEEKAHGTALFPVACYDDDLTEKSVPWHWHEELEAVIVTEGNVVFSTDREQHVLRKGEGCIVNGGALHAAWREGSDPCRIHSLVFHPRLLGGSSESIYWQKYLLPVLRNKAFSMLPIRENADMLDSLRRAWEACANEPPDHEITVRSALSELLPGLIACIPAAPAKPSDARRRYEDRLKNMLRYIQEHLAEEITVRDIGSAAAVSESECIRCFRSVIGLSPIRYTKQLRLQKAAELLVSVDRKINEIARECGFREMNYFTKAFREQYHMTPTEYRRLHNGQV